MLEPIQNNSIFNDIIQKAHSDTQKLKYIIEYLCNNRAQAKHILSLIDVSTKTIKDYQTYINRFLDFCQSNPIDNNIYLNYKKHLNETWLKPTTVNKYLVVAKLLLKELARQGLINDITINTKLNRVGSHHKKFGHSIEEIKRIKQHFDDSPKTPKNLRMELVFHLGAIYGFRRKEMRLIRYEDIDFFNNRINILGKGKLTQETIYISSKTTDLLKRFCKSWRISSGHLFISSSNNNSRNLINNVSMNNIYTQIRAICGTNATLHGFRHFFTTELIKKDIPLRTVQKMTRHKSMNMLQVYNDEVHSQTELSEIHTEVFSDLI